MKLSRRQVRLGLARLLVIPFLWFAAPTPGSLLLGGSLALLGAVIRGWAAGYLTKDSVLAVAGPYAHVRNPLYLGSLLMGMGVTLAGGQPAFVILFLAYFLVVYSYAALAEADELRERFGPAYQAYAAAVPRFVPRLVPWRPEPTSAASFSPRLYRDNREWEAGLGIVVGMGALALKMIFWG